VLLFWAVFFASFEPLQPSGCYFPLHTAGLRFVTGPPVPLVAGGRGWRPIFLKARALVVVPSLFRRKRGAYYAGIRSPGLLSSGAAYARLATPPGGLLLG
jgi:hypothetical protein